MTAFKVICFISCCFVLYYVVSFLCFNCFGFNMFILPFDLFHIGFAIVCLIHFVTFAVFHYFIWF